MALRQLWDEGKMRASIQAALRSRDLDRLTRLSFFAGVGGMASDYERIAREELDRLDEATRHWWQGPCNCHGQFN